MYLPNLSAVTQKTIKAGFSAVFTSVKFRFFLLLE